ncbi:MAG: hypothetical protein RI918_1839, partial [Pseudomonadota bacterium]
APAPAPAPAATCIPPIHVPGARYSLVYKACEAGTNVYYDKTECVKDNTTGLIWQGQTPAGTGLRANNAPKTNFDSTAGKQNDNNGNPIPATTAQINDPNNTIGFKTAVNATNLCGSNAWRLPTRDELVGLVKAAETPKIDNAWFPNVPTSGFYWSSTPHNLDQYAYTVNFDTGSGTGIGDRSKIFIIFVVLFFQILVVVRDQASALRPELMTTSPHKTKLTLQTSPASLGMTALSWSTATTYLAKTSFSPPAK